MDDRILNLANLALGIINKESELKEYIKVDMVGTDPQTLPLANLLIYLEKYYDKATDLKTVLNYFTEEMGIKSRRCVLLVAIEDDDLYRKVAHIIMNDTLGIYIARSKNLEETLSMIRFFDLIDLSCGLIIDGLYYDEIFEKCNLPCCVITTKLSVPYYVKLLASGVSAIVPLTQNWEFNFKNALTEMFIDLS